MKKSRVIFCLFLLGNFLSIHAQADIYKCNGDAGVPAFVDGQTKANYKNCTLMMRDNGSPSRSNSSPRAAQTATPADFPRVEKQVQNQRDDKRKQILLSELETEQKALAGAKNQGAQAEASSHEKNIELLKKEVGALK